MGQAGAAMERINSDADDGAGERDIDQTRAAIKRTVSDPADYAEDRDAG